MGRVPGMRTHALGGVRSRNRKQTPLAGDALEDMRPVVEKVQAGTRDEVLYRLDTRTSPGAACAITRAPVWTAMPASLSSTRSHSPV